jgi:hypothetical protein
LSLEEIPPTLESYAVIPFSKESASRPFKEYRDGYWLRYGTCWDAHDETPIAALTLMIVLAPMDGKFRS